MNEIKIMIDNKEYTTQAPKAGFWRELIKFDEHKKELKTADFIDEHAKIIAKAFKNLTPEQILDNVDLDEIVPLYHKIFLYTTELITRKLKVDEKNE